MSKIDCNINTVVNCEQKTRLLSTSNYERPKQTLTDTLQTNERMKEKLQNYVRVDDIDDVNINTHVRYVTLKDGVQRFCLGGLLIKKFSKYVILSNGTYSWSVQKFHWEQEDDDEPTFDTVFFKVLSKQERQENIIKKKDEEIQKLKNYILSKEKHI